MYLSLVSKNSCIQLEFCYPLTHCRSCLFPGDRDRMMTYIMSRNRSVEETSSDANTVNGEHGVRGAADDEKDERRDTRDAFSNVP